MKRYSLAEFLSAALGITVLALTLILSTACASGGTVSLPPQLTDTMREACTFYQKSRPSIVAYRAWAQEHWNDQVTLPDGTVGPLIPADAKDLLLELDSYLPKLDNAGRLVCLVAEGGLPPSENTAVSGSVDWDRVLSTTMRVATIALELKAQGAF